MLVPFLLVPEYLPLQAALTQFAANNIPEWER
jgi:hypothetical protein